MNKTASNVSVHYYDYSLSWLADLRKIENSLELDEEYDDYFFEIRAVQIPAYCRRVKK